MPRLLLDYPVPHGAGLVDLQIEMLEQGAISVRGASAVELTQETFQCFFRCLGDTVPPDVSEALRRTLNDGDPPALDATTIAAAAAPLPAAVYDIVDTTSTVAAVRHTGLCINNPADYHSSSTPADAFGVEVRAPGSTTRLGYGRDVPQPTATLLYRATLGELGLVLLPLTTASDLARIDHYKQRIAAGARPTALAYGCHANDRCAVAVVVDGHHKLAAAAATGSPVGLLVFLTSRLLTSYADCPRLHPHPSVPLASIRRRIAGPAHDRDAWADELEVNHHHRPPRRPG